MVGDRVQIGSTTIEEMSALASAVFAGIDFQTETAVDELVVVVNAEDLPPVAKRAHADERLRMDYLRSLSGVDLGDRLQVVYHLYSTIKRQKMVLKANLPADRPAVPSVIGVWRGADWHEREAAELFGISFPGHPDLRPLLLADDQPGHPMLKSFALGERGRQKDVDLGLPSACPAD